MFLPLLHVDWREVPRCCVISSGFTPPPVHSSSPSRGRLTSARAPLPPPHMNVKRESSGCFFNHAYADDSDIRAKRFTRMARQLDEAVFTKAGRRGQRRNESETFCEGLFTFVVLFHQTTRNIIGGSLRLNTS